MYSVHANINIDAYHEDMSECVQTCNRNPHKQTALEIIFNTRIQTNFRRFEKNPIYLSGKFELYFKLVFLCLY